MNEDKAFYKLRGELIDALIYAIDKISNELKALQKQEGESGDNSTRGGKPPRQ